MALGLGTFLLGLFPVADGDIFWHLAAGREMVRARGWLRVDPFTLSAAGRPWPDVHWLFQLGVYAVHRLGRAARARGRQIARGGVGRRRADRDRGGRGGGGSRATRPRGLRDRVAGGAHAGAAPRPGAAHGRHPSHAGALLRRARDLRAGWGATALRAAARPAHLEQLPGPRRSRPRCSWRRFSARRGWPRAAPCAGGPDRGSPPSARCRCGASRSRSASAWPPCSPPPYGLSAVALPVRLLARLAPTPGNVFSAEVAENVSPLRLETVAPDQVGHLRVYLVVLLGALAYGRRRLRLAHALLVAAFPRPRPACRAQRTGCSTGWRRPSCRGPSPSRGPPLRARPLHPRSTRHRAGGGAAS